jgi:hypothetical protein
MVLKKSFLIVRPVLAGIENVYPIPAIAYGASNRVNFSRAVSRTVSQRLFQQHRPILIR